MKDMMIGVDLAKAVFQVHGALRTGEVQFRKKLTRKQFSAFMAKQDRCLVIFEACGCTHHWAREMKAQGLEHQHRVHRLTSGAGLARRIRLAPDPLEQGPEFVPRHHGINLDQRILLRVQARVTIRKIKETQLCHRRIPRAGSSRQLCRSAKAGAIFRGAPKYPRGDERPENFPVESFQRRTPDLRPGWGGGQPPACPQLHRMA